ncbi:MAG TPA: sigma-70 family RNA polymerase sigma factor [Gemmatimonadota bacterium]|nr:sigma-70 family RNA polymerase sigma factor [Gemmatimonadota bacterium]
MMDEADLIRRARRGDPAAFRALYDRHADRVWAVVRRLAGDDSLAQDFAQDAWIRIHHALTGFRGEAALSTWIHRVAVSAAMDGLRRADRLAADALPKELPDPGPAASVVDRVALERALDRLPDRMREVLVLHDVEGYTHEEIGSAMGVASGTSRSQLFKARAKLRAMMSAPAAGARDRREPCAT